MMNSPKDHDLVDLGGFMQNYVLNVAPPMVESLVGSPGPNENEKEDVMLPAKADIYRRLNIQCKTKKPAKIPLWKKLIEMRQIETWLKSRYKPCLKGRVPVALVEHLFGQTYDLAYCDVASCVLKIFPRCRQRNSVFYGIASKGIRQTPRKRKKGKDSVKYDKNNLSHNDKSKQCDNSDSEEVKSSSDDDDDDDNNDDDDSGDKDDNEYIPVNPKYIEKQLKKGSTKKYETRKRTYEPKSDDIESHSDSDESNIPVIANQGGLAQVKTEPADLDSDVELDSVVFHHPQVFIENLEQPCGAEEVSQSKTPAEAEISPPVHTLPEVENVQWKEHDIKQEVSKSQSVMAPEVIFHPPATSHVTLPCVPGQGCHNSSHQDLQVSLQESREEAERLRSHIHRREQQFSELRNDFFDLSRQFMKISHKFQSFFAEGQNVPPSTRNLPSQMDVEF